mgnify:CR=1 FL=1
MRRHVAIAAISLCACAPVAPVNEPIDGVVEQWLSLVRSGTVDESALHEKAQLVNTSGVVVGSDNIRATVAAVSIAPTVLIDAHHCVGKMRTTSGSLFFVRSNCDGKIETILNFENAIEVTPSDTLRAYQDAWNEAQPASKLEGGFHADGVYVDPTVDAHGRTALVKAIGDFRRQFQGATLASAPTIKLLGDRNFAFDWDIEMRGDTIHGFDVGAFADNGQVGFIAGFFSRP